MYRLMYRRFASNVRLNIRLKSNWALHDINFLIIFRDWRCQNFEEMIRKFSTTRISFYARSWSNRLWLGVLKYNLKMQWYSHYQSCPISYQNFYKALFIIIFCKNLYKGLLNLPEGLWNLCKSYKCPLFEPSIKFSSDLLGICIKRLETFPEFSIKKNFRWKLLWSFIRTSGTVFLTFYRDFWIYRQKIFWSLIFQNFKKG